jgi:hypothetical protein
MEELIVDLKKIMVKHIRKGEWGKVEYIKDSISNLNQKIEWGMDMMEYEWVCDLKKEYEVY